MNLRTLQLVFVLSWVAWACMPLWGAAVFSSMEVVLLFGLWQRIQRAQAGLQEDHAAVLDTLDEAQRAWAAKYPFFYSQRPAAKEWARLLRASALALMLLIPIFAVQAFIRSDLWLLFALGPAVIFIVLNSMLAAPLEVDDWTKDEGHEADKVLHDAVTKAFASRAIAGVDLSNLPARLGRPAGLPPEEPPASGPPPGEPPPSA